MHPTGNLRILDRLAAQGLLSEEHRHAVLERLRREGGRVEEALIETQALDEGDLLKFLATHHRTRFVSTGKLSKAQVDRFAVQQVPRKLAEAHGVYPVMFDAQTGTLSLVTPDPDDAGALHEVQLVSGAKEVVAYVARPAAVRAAIARAYAGDIHAFAVLDRQAHEQFTTILDVFERKLLSEESIAVALAAETPRERMLDAEELTAASGPPAAPHVASGAVAIDAYIETLNVLVSLIEKHRVELRGHSGHVARLARKLCERIGVSELETAGCVIGAYVHDLGKMGAYHLTALNVAEYEGHRAAARKVVRTPSRLLEATELPQSARRAVESMYERYDGQGFPGALAAKNIPLGARILALADTYADLTQNPRNPYRRALKPAEACEVLARFKGSVFDPNIADLFQHVVTGEDLRAQLLANRYRALLVDPDPEEATVLELRMVEQGFEVEHARGSDQALQALERGEIQIAVCETDLKPQDGLELLAYARTQAWGAELPWVVISCDGRREIAQRAFELGAADFVMKPLAADLLVAKMKQVLERAHATAKTRGVSGSLREMSLPDIVQVLWHGRKTGSLRIRARGETGEIHFVDGAITNALWARLRGAEAFFAMLALHEGDFALDPTPPSSARLIHESPEALLLEGMRRLDEGGRAAAS